MFLKDLCIKPAVFSLLALCFCSVVGGCQSHRPDPSAFNQPMTNAYALSGGKITHFIAEPGLPADPVDKSTLEACRNLPITSGVAKHAYVIVPGPDRNVPITALVVDKYVLVTIGEVSRILNIPTMDNLGVGITFFPLTPRSMAFAAGSKFAQAGSAKVKLDHPVYWAKNGGLVLTLTDLQKVFAASAKQGGRKLNVIKIIDHLGPLGRAD